MEFGTWGKHNDGTDYHTGKGTLNVSDDVDCPVCLETKKRNIISKL